MSADQLWASGCPEVEANDGRRPHRGFSEKCQVREEVLRVSVWVAPQRRERAIGPIACVTVGAQRDDGASLGSPVT